MEKLQKVTPCKVMSFNQTVNELNWNLEDDGKYLKVTCDCENSKISYFGFFGTEVIRCENCGKEMTDLFSPIQTGNSSCTILGPSNFEIEKDENGHDKHWIAETRKGLILKESEETSCN